MNDVFTRDEQEQQPAETPAEVVAPEQTVETAPEQSGADGAPTAPSTDKHVPLAALEDERSKRRDWKEKALRFEGELKALREMQERSAQQQPHEPQQPQDPLQAMEQRFVNMTLNASERLARKSYGDEAVSKAFEKFRSAVQQNPMLQQQALNHPDPWEFVYQEGQKLSMLEEIGTDPKAYEEKVRAKLMAELQPSNQPPAQPSAQIPQSLANARSTAARSASPFTGPAPFDSLFKN